MKRILHLSKYYPPYCGGIEDVVYNYVDELKDDYRQRVICFNHERGRKNELYNNIEVFRVNTIGEIASQPISFDYFWEIKRQIRQFRPDIIHVHLPNPLVCYYLKLIHLKDIKLVIHWHADILGKKSIYPFIQSSEDYILKRANHIIATSQEYASASVPLRPYADKITILPNTINALKLNLHDIHDNTIASIRKRYDNQPIVLFVGRHVEYKGIPFLIDAARYMPKNVTILIAGTGPDTPFLKMLAQDSNNIHFIGRITNEEIRYYMHSATVFAFPSIDRREAFGVALAEALYCGLPAVSFNIEGSGTTWVNQHEKSGYIVPNRDSKAFAEAVMHIINDPECQARLSEQAHQWVEQNFMHDQIHKVSAIYDQC